MQKLTLSLTLAAALFVTACDIGSFAVPEKLTIQGKPGVHIPLGSPFASNADLSPAKLLEDYMSIESMKKMIGASMPGLEIFLYGGSEEARKVQTYLVRYPITELPLNLSEYMRIELHIPEVEFSTPADVTSMINTITSTANEVNNQAVTGNDEIAAGNSALDDKNILAITNANTAINAAKTAINGSGTVDAKNSVIVTSNNTIRTSNSNTSGNIGKINADRATSNAAVAANVSTYINNLVTLANTSINKANTSIEEENTIAQDPSSKLKAKVDAIVKAYADIIDANTKIATANQAIGTVGAGLAKYDFYVLLYTEWPTLKGIFQEQHPNGYPINSVPPIDLKDIATMIDYIDYEELGIRIPGDYAGKIKLGIQAGDGFDDFDVSTGEEFTVTDHDDPGYGKLYTKFVAKDKTWWPKTANEGKATLSLTILEPPMENITDTITLAPEFVLEWKKALVKPGESGERDGNLPLDLTDLSDTGVFSLEGFTGPINAYMYLSGLPEGNANTLGLGYNTIGDTPNYTDITKGDKKLTSIKPSVKDVLSVLPTDSTEFNGEIPHDSLWDPNLKSSLDLTAALNSAAKNKIDLNYHIVMGEMEIERDSVDKDLVISAELLFTLPMSVNINAFTDGNGQTIYPSIPFENGAGKMLTIEEVKAQYIQIEFEALSEQLNGKDDLLGREKDGDKIFEVIENINKVKIGFSAFNNTLLTTDLFVAIAPHEGAKGKLLNLSEAKGLSLEDFSFPFAPKVEILILKTQKKSPESGYEDYGTISIGRGGELDFNLEIDAGATIDYSVDF